MDRAVIRRMHDVRARAVATMILTRRDDLIPVTRDSSSATDPDLRVQVRRPGPADPACWDVYLQAIGSDAPPPLDDPLWTTIATRFDRTEPLTLPTCVILPSLRADRAFFTWVVGPFVVEGSPVLGWNGPWKSNPVELTHTTLDQVVAAVSSWADASVRAATPASARTGSRRSEPSSP